MSGNSRIRGCCVFDRKSSPVPGKQSKGNIKELLCSATSLGLLAQLQLLLLLLGLGCPLNCGGSSDGLRRASHWLPQRPDNDMQKGMRASCDLEHSTEPLWEENVRRQNDLAFSLGAHQSLVIDSKLQGFTRMPWLKMVGLTPKGIQCVSRCHCFGLNFCRACMVVHVLHFTCAIGVVAGEVVHVLQAMCLEDGHCQLLWASAHKRAHRGAHSICLSSLHDTSLSLWHTVSRCWGAGVGHWCSCAKHGRGSSGD